jgi:PAS domain S-box-containing protein
MLARVSLLQLVSLAVLLGAITWATVFWLRLRDWRMGCVCGLLVLVALRLAHLLCMEGFAEDMPLSRGVGDVLDLAFSLLAMAGVLFFRRGLETHLATRKELERTEGLLKAAIEQCPAGIAIADAPDGRLVLANAAALGIKGDSDQPLIDITIDLYEQRWKTLHPDGTPFKSEDLPLAQAVMHGRKMRNVNIVVERANGEKRWVLANAAPVRDKNGRIIAGVVVFPDITDLKKAERERKVLEKELGHARKMESLGTLAGGIAHDFNNVLAAILGFSELALDDLADDAPARARIERLREAAARARRVVDQILSFSRNRKPELKAIVIQDVVKETIELLRASLPSTIEIRARIEPQCGTVLAEPAQIEQVVVNLATNGAHAMPDGGTLDIIVDEVAVDHALAERITGIPPGPYVRITVRDQGHGMGGETIQRIFDPFYTTKEANKGTGLGLAQVLGIVKQHSGAIHVESAPNKGTRVDVYLPRAMEVEFPATMARRPLETGSERVLLVDDEPDVAEVGREHLAHLGYTVTSLTDSRTALAMFREHPDAFDVIVTDLTMPALTGIDLAEEALRIRPVPILLSTGYLDGATRQLPDGVRLLRKPYTRAELARAVRRSLDTSIVRRTK